MEYRFLLHELPQFAERFWHEAGEARVFAFHGGMGAGKTTIIEALCRHRGVRDTMSSPTFSIINEYRFGAAEEFVIYHIDLYRLRDEQEVEQAGVEDCVFSGSHCFVEWPEKAPALFDEYTLRVYVEPVGEDERAVRIERGAGSTLTAF
jgi:tRNA threonylcarbamoyladenosine biosynthesis protein TsaE